MCKNYSSCSADRGLTLIEVVVALALLSTLFVGVLVAFNRHAEQIRESRKTLDVVRRLDALLYEWRAEGGTVPPDDTGEFPGDDDLVWKTEVVGTRYRRNLGVDVVRITVQPRRKARSDRVVVALELAVPVSKWPIEEADHLR